MTGSKKISSSGYTLAAIIDSQDLSGGAYPWTFKYVLIPLAWPFTWLFLKVGVGPNQATIIRLATLIAAFVCMLVLADDFMFLAIAVFFVALVLDCTDGQICRVTDTASYFGKFFDGLIDSIMQVCLPLVLAIGYQHIYPDENLLIISGVATAAYALTELSILRFALTDQTLQAARASAKTALPTYELPGSDAIKRLHERGVLDFFDYRMVNVAFDIRYSGLFLALVIGRIDWYLHVLAIFQSSLFIGFFHARVMRASINFNVWRRSATARSADESPTE